MKMKCLIVDDDDLSRGILEDLIQDTDSLDLIASCGDPIKAFNILKDGDIDLLFLDIEMPKMDGISMLKTLNPLPQVILVTSHDKYAVESYDYEVADFVKKPISTARFLKAIEKASKRLTKESSHFTTKGETIFIKSDSKLVQISTNQIYWIEALGNYMRVITEDGKYTILSTMKDVAAKLSSDDFVRVHRSFIVRQIKLNQLKTTTLLLMRIKLTLERHIKMG